MEGVFVLNSNKKTFILNMTKNVVFWKKMYII